MTVLVFRADPYLQDCTARVIGHTAEGAVLVDRSIFYPTGGGQPGDSGWLRWDGGRLPVATAIKVEGGLVGLVPAEPAALPDIGTELRLILDWERRYRHMRMHTALHLLSVVIPLPVSGGQIGAERSRLDFDMPDPPEDVAAIEDALNALIDRDLPVREAWILTLGVELVDGDFFELGGDSLQVIAMLGRITTALGVDVPLIAAFFGDPTLPGLVKVIREGMRSAPLAPLVGMPRVPRGMISRV